MAKVRGNLKTGYTKKDPPSGVNAVDSVMIAGRRKGKLRPGTVLTLVDQSKFEVHTTAIHGDLVEWHWKLVGGDEDRLEAVVEVFNYGDSPVHGYLTCVGSPVLARDCCRLPDVERLDPERAHVLGWLPDGQWHEGVNLGLRAPWEKRAGEPPRWLPGPQER